MSCFLFVCLFCSLSRADRLSVKFIVDVGVFFARSPYLGLSG